MAIYRSSEDILRHGFLGALIFSSSPLRLPGTNRLSHLLNCLYRGIKCPCGRLNTIFPGISNQDIFRIFTWFHNSVIWDRAHRFYRLLLGDGESTICHNQQMCPVFTTLIPHKLVEPTSDFRHSTLTKYLYRYQGGTMCVPSSRSGQSDGCGIS
jgi:hypothetical protein